MAVRPFLKQGIASSISYASLQPLTKSGQKRTTVLYIYGGSTRVSYRHRRTITRANKQRLRFCYLRFPAAVLTKGYRTLRVSQGDGCYAHALT